MVLTFAMGMGRDAEQLKCACRYDCSFLNLQPFSFSHFVRLSILFSFMSISCTLGFEAAVATPLKIRARLLVLYRAVFDLLLDYVTP